MALSDITPEEERKIEALLKGHKLTEDTYDHLYYCFNCGYRGEVKIPRGTAVKHYRCPRCACTDADLTGT